MDTYSGQPKNVICNAVNNQKIATDVELFETWIISNQIMVPSFKW